MWSVFHLYAHLVGKYSHNSNSDWMCLRLPLCALPRPIGGGQRGRDRALARAMHFGFLKASGSHEGLMFP